ncbi:hypothetical protein CANTEDRAFT_112304 [Yamadazyma tenuis ATCC 10573]|uniref:HTH araC/xylS-type domain-containing protein n=1 Tax=Candida tenuis (strain ATCC 10573 / BCRC 21748 / CBS 615 / JCM 9827 / NBRC 10315 / NRRL Y-1498 / VKM Y-70) TaxID=590646 RepID=G3AWQ2_CANTC|nr:uncharacterized protein CANTEDRAFT_112304 [Yamadazyma tenuis ATCC 10573]EGV66833.1 hypothetical protein CANTEDRAFT_112304 [Yamadazyma tenuis ATCC 10573]
MINEQRPLSKDMVQSVNLSKNDSDHYRLVDLACRHLAHAAATNLFFPKKYADEDVSTVGGKKKRRRGGVLGFKELAAKSKLSAWHFHRVFKSVTGLTPKTYGDRCNEFLEKFKDSEYVNYSKFNQSITPVSQQTSLNNSTIDNHHIKRQKVSSMEPMADNYGYNYSHHSSSLPNMYQNEAPVDTMVDQYYNALAPTSAPVPSQFGQYQMPVQPQFDFQPQTVSDEVQTQTYPFSNRSSIPDLSMSSTSTSAAVGTANISPISLEMDEVQVPSIFKKDYKIDIPDITGDFGSMGNLGLMDSGAPMEPIEFLNQVSFDDNDFHEFLASV